MVEQRLSDEQRALVERYLPLAERMAADWSRRCPRWKMCCYDAAVDALCRAAILYDPAKGTVGTYLCHKIRFGLLDLYRQIQRNRRECSRFFKNGFGVSRDDHFLPLFDEGSVSVDPDLRSVDLRDEVDYYLDGLPERDVTVLRSLFLDNCTFKETGQQLGVSESRVHRIYRRLIPAS